MYLPTSDYVRAKHAPGSVKRIGSTRDRPIAGRDRSIDATLVVTADHGMRAKAYADGGRA
jgi:hypothetical protein